MKRIIFLSMVSFAFSSIAETNHFAIIVVEQQNSNRNGVDWNAMEKNLSQQDLSKMQNPNELFYNKQINNICDSCYFFDNYNFDTKLNAGIVKYNVYPFLNESGFYSINFYIAVARCGEFYLSQKYNFENNKNLFQNQTYCGNNPDKSIITTVYLK